MQFIPSNRDDILRYYRNTYTKLSGYGDMLFFIETVDSNRVLGKCENGDPFCIYMDDETPFTMDYILPHKSFFQNGADAVQLQRVPAKQYYRGLCASNVQLLYMRADGTLRPKELSFEILKKFVSKQPFSTLQGAISNMDALTVALSPRMMYHRTSRQIYIDFTPVAKVNPGKLRVTVNRPIFLDEINEVLAARGDNKVFKAEIYQPPPPKEKTKTADLQKEMGETAAQAELKAKLKKKFATVPAQFPNAWVIDPIHFEENQE